MVFIWPFLSFGITGKAIVFTLLPSFVFSCLFMLNSQINHLNSDCIHASSSNFLKHQIITAQNFGTDSQFCYVLSGGLNYQVEHHLYPFVNHCHLPKLAPHVKKLCKKYSLPYHEADGYIDALQKHLEHTKAMSLEKNENNFKAI